MSRTPDESELIADCFVRTPGEATLIGPGDDAAVVRVAAGDAGRVVCSTDTLLEGAHFAKGMPADALGRKALAVNLSDFAAMGATPKWALVALTTPDADKAWCKAFASGFFSLADRYGVDLVGGDLTRGPLTVTVQLLGVQEGPILRRTGAQAGDRIYLSGDIGDAAIAFSGVADAALTARAKRRLDYPEPRVRAGCAIARHATAGIDVSDGLLKDLGCLVGDCGAEIHIDRLPLGEACAQYCAASGDYAPALTGGDDYELLFTAPSASEDALREAVGGLPEEDAVALTHIGDIVASPGVRIMLEGREHETPERLGFDHFAAG